MTENPQDRPTDKPPLADQIRAKLDEYEVDRHLNEIAETVESVVRQGVSKVGDLAHEHRGDIDRLIEKAATAVDRRTEGKHADRISQVRGTLERGVGKLAEQRVDPAAADSAAPEASADDAPTDG